MWKQVSISEAASILLAGGHVDAGFYQWAGTLELRYPWRWRKARKRRELERKLAGRWNQGDGWWVYSKG